MSAAGPERSLTASRQSTQPKPRVVIVGAGPAGASLALVLAREGVPVELVERSRNCERQFRGEALMPSGLEALAAMQLDPLLDGLPQRPLDGWRVLIEGRELIQVREPTEPGQRCTLISQPPLLEALTAAAQRCPSLRWHPGQMARDLIRKGNRVAGVILANGRQLPAELVIAADGRHSRLRQLADLALEPQPGRLDLLWFRVPGLPAFEQANLFTTVVAGGDAFSCFLGAADGRLQLGWLRRSNEPPLGDGAAWARRLAAASPSWLADHLAAQADSLTSARVIQGDVGLAPRWHRPGLLLLGDAAHPMSPVRAQGINMALRDAWATARTLLPLLSGGEPIAGDPTAAIDVLLPRIMAARIDEVQRLQRLQAEELQRAEWLRRQPWLGHGLALGAPVLAGPLGRHWWSRQQALRQGSP